MSDFNYDAPEFVPTARDRRRPRPERASNLDIGTKPGPRSREQRQKASVRQRAAWDNRKEMMLNQNAKKPANPVRALRLLTDDGNGSFLAQRDFGFLVLGFSPNNAGRVSQLENGARPPQHLIERMEQYAKENNIEWHYSK